MNTNQRKLLVWSLAVGAVALHLSAGRWGAAMPISLEVCLYDVDGSRSFGWGGPGNHAALIGIVPPSPWLW